MATDPDLAGLSNLAYSNSLLGEFFEDGCLDELRHIATELGARPYRVFLVRTRWSGKKRGQGVETVIDDEEVTPPPKVEAMSGVQLQLLDVGLDEQGGLSISEISPRYTENQLFGRNQDGSGLAENETFSWEITLMKGDGTDAYRRRRFMIRGTPSYDATGLQWRVSVTRAGSDRESNGSPT